MLCERDIIIAKLTERIAELERRLGLNSFNSSKPPSSDGLRKKPRYNMGDRIKAAAIYLQHQHFIPEDRLSELLGDLFAVPISTATLAKMGERFSEQLAPFEAQVLDFLKYAPVKNLDETSYRIGGKTKLLHVLCNEHATHYRAGINRGDVPVGFTGTIVHDHFKISPLQSHM